MPDQFTFRNAIGNMINSLPYWQPNRYTQLYGNKPAQFADINSQIGASFNNIMPQPTVPSWAVQNLPPRLQGPGYLNGGSVGNYGSLFGNRWGNGPRGVGNPYPGNGYNLLNMSIAPANANGVFQNPFMQSTPTPMGPPYQWQAPVGQPQQPGTTSPGTTSPGTGGGGVDPGNNQGQTAPTSPPPYATNAVDPNKGLEGYARYAAQAQQAAQIPPNSPPGQPYTFETAPNTTDPGSMSGLIGILGGGLPQMQAYQTWYQQTYGNQAPGGPKAYWP